MKKNDEEENENFCDAKKSISTLRGLFSATKKHFEKIFAQDDVSLAELKKDFRKICVNASLFQNLENSGF